MFYENIIKKLNEADVKYAIVGGVAVNLHGHIRMTADLDIILEMEDDNIAKTISVLKEAGFSCKIPVDPMGLARAEIRNDWIKNKNMKALNFYHRLEEIDLVIDSPVKYSSAKKILFVVKEIKYPVISKNDLIKMKQKTDRAQDREDIRKLKILKKIENDRDQTC